MMERARALAALHRNGPTTFEARNLIVDRAGGTTYGKWLQCLNEINACLKHIDKRDPDPKDLRLEEMVKYAEELKAQLGELTPERELDLEQELHRYRVRKRLAFDLYLYGKASEGTLDMILVSSEALRREMLGILKDPTQQQRLCGWVEGGAPALEA